MLTIKRSADKECVQLLLTVNERRSSETTDGPSMRSLGVIASIPVGELLIHFDRSCLVKVCSPKDEQLAKGRTVLYFMYTSFLQLCYKEQATASNTKVNSCCVGVECGHHWP
jgi:hypothetical protein